MRENEYNDVFLKDTFHQHRAKDEFNLGVVFKDNVLGNEYNNCYNPIVAKDVKLSILFKLIFAVFFCGIISFTVVASPKPIENVVVKSTKFNSLIITTENNFLCYQLDFVDENNYWQNFLVILSKADGTKEKVLIAEGEEKIVHTTSLKTNDLLQIEVFCDSQDNFGIEYNDHYNKTLIHKYIF